MRSDSLSSPQRKLSRTIQRLPRCVFLVQRAEVDGQYSLGAALVSVALYEALFNPRGTERIINFHTAELPIPLGVRDHEKQRWSGAFHSIGCCVPSLIETTWSGRCQGSVIVRKETYRASASLNSACAICYCVQAVHLSGQTRWPPLN